MPTSRHLSKVYRLRNLPAHVDRLAAAELLVSAIGDANVTTSDIEIGSLATAVDSWKRWQMKVATLRFIRVPSVILQDTRATEGDSIEWKFNVPGLSEPLILDDHFHGLTALNDVGPTEHEYDCIAISGLASHPIGSWQPKSDDRSFMWIRDALPKTSSGIRFLIYGYNTKIDKSKSFQTIIDLARTLILELGANGWASPASKPILFLAHSLGGVLIKQILVMLADGNERAVHMLGLVKGAIFFGTPSIGMPISHLLAMVDGQPNKNLIVALSDKSTYLANLEMQFSGISYLQKLKFFWAFETKTSPTVVKDTKGNYSRTGPRSIMVDQHSATGGRYLSDPEATIQIDEDHSGMVKFKVGDHRIPIIASKIVDICWSEVERQTTKARLPRDPDLPEAGFGPSGDATSINMDNSIFLKAQNEARWDYELILDSIRPPERDSRVGQIDTNFGHTFEWAFAEPSVGLAEWLRKGEGIFWISGKPGSGKSTLMKFLLNNSQTKELLHDWRSKSTRLIISFFFHHRGTLLQKSFDGLLRSLLSQVLEMDHRLRPAIIDGIFETNFQNKLKAGQCGTLTADLRTLFRACHVNTTNVADVIELVTRLWQSPSLHLDPLFDQLLPEMGTSQRTEVKRALLAEFDELSDLAKTEQSLSSEIERIWLRISWIDGYRFKRLVNLWLQRCDIDEILQQYVATHSRSSSLRERILFPKQDPETERIQYFIGEIAKRQRVRHQHRLDIQLAEWPRNLLEEGIRGVIDQEGFELDLCVFFDALDEYNGRPEVICDFLKDLARKSPTSKTRTKILFSSRPWPVFITEFRACKGFKIHEHTHEDIQEYCAGFLTHRVASKELIQPFVGEIAYRARGVFLWVKLVLRELIALAARPKGTAIEMTAVLRECLDAIPDELDEYYSSIVQRLPSAARRNTFILLECLSRSTLPLFLEQTPSLIQSGLARTYQEANVPRKLEIIGSTQMDTYLKTISGGLVDIVDDKNALDEVSGISLPTSAPTKGSLIQLLHQTCKDWVESSTFKHIVLGERASVTWENGHSFLVKYYGNMTALKGVQRYTLQFFLHAMEAEGTTGVSQYAYLSQLPPEFYSAIMATDVPAPIQSGLSLAVFGGLWLYLKDSIADNQWVLKETTEPLFYVLLSRAMWEGFQLSHRAQSRQFTSPSEITDMGKYLLQHGFPLENDLVGLSKLMGWIWDSPDRQVAQLYMDLVIKAIERSLRPDIVFPGSFSYSPHGVHWTLLHLSPPPLAKWLLWRGVAVNRTNSEGQTALDYLISSSSLHQARTFGTDWMYEMACLLVEHGGKLRRAPQADLNLFLLKLRKNKYNTAPFESLWSLRLDLTQDVQVPRVEPFETEPVRIDIRHNTQPERKQNMQPDLRQSVQSTGTDRPGQVRKRDMLKRILKLK